MQDNWSTQLKKIEREFEGLPPEPSPAFKKLQSEEQRRAKERAQQQQLVHLGRAAVLGELSGAFAHELSQPLTSILGNAEAALQLLTKPDADLREIRNMVRDIVSDDVRAAEVIQRLRAMLTRGEISREPVDLANVIKDVLDLARIDLSTRHVSVDMAFDPYLPLVLGDRIQLQQVVLNLIVNACESMSSIDAHERRISISAHFDASGDLIIGPLPLLICKKCVEKMTSLLCEESRAVWQKFLAEHFSGPPDVSFPGMM